MPLIVHAPGAPPNLNGATCGGVPMPPIPGSPNVFVGFLPVMRLTDQFLPHPAPPPMVPHPRIVTGTSPDVFANKLPIHRMNDSVVCGGKTLIGNLKMVFANG